MENQDEVKVRKEEDVRSEIIAEYGFDATDDAERIEKLVAKELDHDKKLSSAIGAKIKHRTEAEEFKKQIPLKEEKPPVEDKGLSVMDGVLIAKADVHEEDVELVLKWAKLNGVTVKEALADKTLKTVLREKKEERTTAETTQTKGTGRSPAKVTGDDLLEAARKGKVPESQEEIDKLVAAQFPQKK